MTRIPGLPSVMSCLKKKVLSDKSSGNGPAVSEGTNVHPPLPPAGLFDNCDAAATIGAETIAPLAKPKERRNDFLFILLR